MTKVEVLPLPPDDWQRYRDIRLEALKNEPRAFSSTYSASLQRPPEFWQGRLAEAAAGENSWLLFAQVEGQIIGLIGAFLSEEAQAAEIISVYVQPAWRRQGVGRVLMAAILEAVSQNPAVRKAVLNVNARQPGAVALYQDFGFQVTGEVEAVLGDGNVYPEYLMEKILSNCSAGR
jgi:ribosomal protein S18 acetylase RimI-like enzyme